MNDNVPQEQANTDLEVLLSTHAPSGAWRRWRWVVIAVLIVMVFAAYFLFRDGGEVRGPRYSTAAAVRSTLVVKVTATGNLEPTNQVNVGSELSGTVAAVYVDEDDHVTKGQVLAELDPSKFEDAVARARGSVAVAEGSRQQNQATLDETQAKLARYREVARLSDHKVPSKTEMETAEAEAARAKANLASAKANLMEARAALRSGETDLAKTRIKSPIDGIVLVRSVDPGQAVAASLQAVTLFSLAEDLSKMELKVDVDEADVGQVKAGLPATFTVDAWPDRVFGAVITRVGFNASNSDGVISYPAVLRVENTDLSLRPGMTATAEITSVTRENALLVPNAALRFTPATNGKATQQSRGIVGSLFPRPPRSQQRVKTTEDAKDGKRVWILKEGKAVPVKVHTGATNGRVTEITGGDLREGDAVIVEAASVSP
ncbi:MAG: efflux RND transporter periplasmic adaptor subunit [Gammaproteobacteria bacterium]|nr:efflux RND transporter periplasmic adaptor subunit [Gammaproteobacteria bacterium]